MTDQDKATQLREQIATLEAKLITLREKLAKLEAKMGGDAPAPTGLDILWKTALPKSRLRSSKYKCRVAWNRIPKKDRPPVQVLIDALVAWNKCDEWKKDHGQYAIALDRWITERRWEDVPESEKRSSRYVTIPKPIQPTEPDDAVTDREEIKALLGITKKPTPETSQS